MSKNQGYIDRLYGRVDAVYIDFGVLDYHVAKYECTGCCSAWTEYWNWNWSPKLRAHRRHAKFLWRVVKA